MNKETTRTVKMNFGWTITFPPLLVGLGAPISSRDDIAIQHLIADDLFSDGKSGIAHRNIYREKTG
jgi:hypothetical protein